MLDIILAAVQLVPWLMFAAAVIAWWVFDPKKR